MISPSKLNVTVVDDSELEFSRSALVVIRNALIELCNGSYYPVDDPELATVIGYERHEIQAALDRTNKVLSLGPTAADLGEFVLAMSPDGSRVTPRLQMDDVKVYALALANVGFVRGANLWDELGAAFNRDDEIDGAQREKDLHLRVGAPEAEIKALKERLYSFAFDA